MPILSGSETSSTFNHKSKNDPSLKEGYASKIKAD
jgi:hypothetical protein